MDLALQLDQPKAHSFQKSFRMRWLAPGPTPDYWDCVLREQISAGSRPWDKGCPVSNFSFFWPFAPQFGHGLLVWSKNKGGGGGPPGPLPWIRHCKQLTPIRRIEIMSKLDTASCHLSKMNTSGSLFFSKMSTSLCEVDISLWRTKNKPDTFLWLTPLR